MRTIKFRGIDTISGEMVYGDLVQQELSDGNITTAIVQTYATYDVKTESVGQFTGLTDINGHEIYEGDIVRVRVTNDRFKKNPRFRNGVVTFCEYDGGWTNGCYLRFLPQRMEVIGNIHDNPELMEAAAK